LSIVESYCVGVGDLGDYMYIIVIINSAPKFALASFLWKQARSFNAMCWMVSIRGRLFFGNLTRSENYSLSQENHAESVTLGEWIYK